MCRYFSTAHIHAYASFSTTEYLRSAAASVGEPKVTVSSIPPPCTLNNIRKHLPKRTNAITPQLCNAPIIKNNTIKKCERSKQTKTTYTRERDLPSSAVTDPIISSISVRNSFVGILKIFLAMATFADECKQYFNTECLYELLNLSKDAKPDRTTIKKAYYKASLKYHPDRVHGKDEKELATKKFQILSKAFDVLYDEDKRAAYDEMGLVDNDWLSHVSDWMTFWRTLFKPVEKQDIDSFYANYIGSEEERYDLKKAYLAKKGDMDYIVDTVCGIYSPEEESRYREILLKMIKNREIPAYKQFTQEDPNKKMKRMKRAKREAQRFKKESEKCPSGDLFAEIAKRAEKRRKDGEAFLDRLAASCSKVTKKSGKKN
ncbi:DnaJ -like protein subfamily C member 9 [Trichinella pseudospiralis]|uniref:DnaJ-like protein subfamily C member 9 n=1 Tax=Trichinella pseudospiralis TaxID=6337 RepID=A0A0V1JDY8_TRIPS|nr:DnaJ -like protein subfamily C member 9 [Trichinella pseudospiralis]